MMAIYYASIVVIVCLAIGVTWAREIPTHAAGATLMCGVAAFALAGAEQSPPNWVVGLMAFQAAAGVWAIVSWLLYRRSR